VEKKARGVMWMWRLLIKYIACEKIECFYNPHVFITFMFL
jgi:hypothetical protein